MKNKHQEDIAHIRTMMERSSRFISLSGLSGIVAGVLALLGVGFAIYLFHINEANYTLSLSGDYSRSLMTQLVVTALVVLLLAMFSGIYFTLRKSKKMGLPVWTAATRQLLLNLIIPLFAGACFCTLFLVHHQYAYIAPATLIFYGLALINASKYTYADVFYLGLCELLLGFVSMFTLSYGIFFWAIGFGIIHIFYGSLLFKKYQ